MLRCLLSCCCCLVVVSSQSCSWCIRLGLGRCLGFCFGPWSSSVPSVPMLDAPSHFPLPTVTTPPFPPTSHFPRKEATFAQATGRFHCLAIRFLPSWVFVSLACLMVDDLFFFFDNISLQCAGCRKNNFASRTTCFSCGTSKPGNVGGLDKGQG